MPESLPELFRDRKPSALILDVDGVLTDNSILLDAEGSESKRFHVPDGGGIKWVQSVGVPVAWLTGRESMAVRARAKELGVLHLRTGISNKATVLPELLEQMNVDARDAVYVGDDWIDLPALALVGFPVAVANAHPLVKQAAGATTTRAGGDGAVREVCEWILQARGDFDEVLARFEP